MTRNLVKLAALLAICFPALVHAESNKTEKITESHHFADPRAENRLIVDSVWGDIEVRGYEGDEVLVKVVKTISAGSEEDIAEIDEEVRLEITKEDDLLELYVDGPFRDRNDRSRSRRWRDNYEARFDFEIQVPRGTDVELSTVNDSRIIVKGVSGDYDIHNVNGGIAMESMAGSGDVYSVNGDVTVDFDKNPSQNSRFGSLNGEVRLSFLPGLSADFYLKTFNGEIFSDFPVTYLPLRAEAHSEKSKGQYVYKVNRKTAVRAGNGGPEIELDGFNGDMFILQKGL